MTAEPRDDAVLDVSDLVMDFRVGGRLIGAGDALRAVDGVSLTIRAGETVALVGESGSGKSTVGRCVVRLLEPTSGEVVLLGRDISHLTRTALRPLRRQMHIVFQDPYSSLNPRMTVGQIIGGPLAHHRIGRRREVRARVGEMLERVGLRADLQDRYPHSLSGGQRQRVAIARALIVGPTLLVADEPISALDASVQASMLNLLVDLQREMQFACLFITHDLSAAQFLADRIAVMYLGQIVEMGSRDEIFAVPRHPYTQSLMSAVLVPAPVLQRRRERFVLSGDPPSPLDPPAGCRFHTRCP
ncbi:MAG TPA: ABC transporter ATP-binding protein, partial [Candidatus Limnocylindrales bacterium]|nr:ABC transporter ATP-binding protein [Candidatus Limnocylindrales bacterium]